MCFDPYHIPPTMKDPTDHTKSLKKFQTIFETFEAGYREASTEDRKEVIEEILVEIHKANKGKLSEDDVVRGVSASFLSSTYAGSELPFMDDSKSSTSIRTISRFSRTIPWPPSRWGSNGHLGWSSITCAMMRLRKLSMPLLRQTLRELLFGPRLLLPSTMVSPMRRRRGMELLLRNGREMAHLLRLSAG